MVGTAITTTSVTVIIVAVTRFRVPTRIVVLESLVQVRATVLIMLCCSILVFVVLDFTIGVAVNTTVTYFSTTEVAREYRIHGTVVYQRYIFVTYCCRERLLRLGLA
jgi:hypothetical protein